MYSEDDTVGIDPKNTPLSSELISKIVKTKESENVEKKDDSLQIPGFFHYQGEFDKEGYLDGMGRIKFEDGTIYEGLFSKNNICSSKGKIRYPDNTLYEGSLSAGKRNGEGKYVFEGKEFTGNWKEDVKSGKGKMKFTNNSYYEGEFSKNLRNGFGKMVYESGNTYVGQWKNNKKNGNGIMTWENQCEMYEGQWRDGIIHGSGKYTYFNKKTGECNFFEGSFTQGAKNGIGTFYYSDGSKLRVNWEDNMKNGRGEFYLLNGCKEIVHFERDKLISGQSFFPNRQVTVNEKIGKEKKNFASLSNIPLLIFDEIYFSDFKTKPGKKKRGKSKRIFGKSEILELKRIISRTCYDLLKIFKYYSNYELNSCSNEPSDSNIRVENSSVFYGLRINKKNEMNLYQFWKFLKDFNIISLQFVSFHRFRNILQRTLWFYQKFSQNESIFSKIFLIDDLEKKVLKIGNKIGDVDLNKIRFRDFYETMIRISIFLYLDDKKSINQSIKYFLEEKIISNIDLISDPEKAKENFFYLYDSIHPQIREIVKQREEILESIFTHFSKGKSFVTIRDLLKGFRVLGVGLEQGKIIEEIKENQYVENEKFADYKVVFVEYVNYFVKIFLRIRKEKMEEKQEVENMEDGLRMFVESINKEFQKVK